MKGEKGFTLVELALIIALIGIIGIAATPLLNNPSLFQARFFNDEFISMLMYGRKVAIASGCEVAIKAQQQEVILYMGENCDNDNFSHPVPYPFIFNADNHFRLKLPNNLTLVPLPIYFDKTGKVYDANHEWKKQIELHINKQKYIIDGFSGFMYEKNN